LASLLDRESVDTKREPGYGDGGRFVKKIRTELLDIAFEEGGPEDGPAVMILHGWPDAPCGWDSIAARLQAEGWRTVIPYLRGSGPTRFLSEETPRVGSGVVLAQDAIDLADALGLGRFAVVGHDWVPEQRI
jgi:pimeloyl-ACP methyl ester carboxylesterase